MQGLAATLMLQQALASSNTSHDIVVQDLQATIEAQKVAIRALEKALANERLERNLVEMKAAGFFAQASTLKTELASIAPDNRLLMDTGAVYPTGKKRLIVNAVYEQAFDAKAIELKMPSKGDKYRMVAK